MTPSASKALAIAHAYVAAMAAGNVDAIMSITAPDVACKSPLGQLNGAEQFRGFQDGFSRMVTKLTVLAVYGDDEQAVVVYDVETHPVPHAVVAEFIKVEDGKLASIEVIYDATPFAAYAASVQAH